MWGEIMAFSNSRGLISVGGVPIPMKFMKAETYSALYSTNDLDSYRDANGVLHRNVLSHRLGKVEFETPPLMTNRQISELMRLLSNAYTVPEEKKLTVTAYMPEIDDYITQDMYIPDIQYPIYWVNGDEIKYNPIRIAFIGY